MTEVVFDRERCCAGRITAAFLLTGGNYPAFERKNLGAVQVFVTALSDLLFNIWTVVKAVEDTRISMACLPIVSTDRSN
jgi:hypothetical protein